MDGPILGASKIGWIEGEMDGRSHGANELDDFG